MESHKCAICWHIYREKGLLRSHITTVHGDGNGRTTITTPNIYITTSNENHNNYVVPLIQPPLRTFSSDDVCHDVFRCYVSFEDGTDTVFGLQTELPFPLHTLTTPAFLSLQYVTSNRLTEHKTNQYYDHMIHRDRIICIDQSSSLTTPFHTALSFQQYC